jgi:hypothetical protein
MKLSIASCIAWAEADFDGEQDYSVCFAQQAAIRNGYKTATLVAV